ncbi:MAG: hypothetical protein F6K35_48965, partial [Okeania sp. SIO2H7]|nr:hypothetical protein [Okeania sp. SIO2H7]
MRLITSILVSSILFISIPGKLQNLGGDRATATAPDNSEILTSERGS